MNVARDSLIVWATFQYYVLTRAMVADLYFGDGPTQARKARHRLQYLADEKLINVARIKYSPDASSATHVYYPSRKGAEYLAEYYDEESYLSRTVRAPEQTKIHHWCAVSRSHITLDKAIALQKLAKVEQWYSEWDVVDPAESVHRPEKRFRIYTLLNEEKPRLVCAPDAAFLLSIGDHKKVYYVEQDRATDSAQRYVASKVKGYAELHARKGHRRHFPTTTMNDFAVLMFCPDANRRKSLSRAIKGQPGEKLWKFCSIDGLTPETFLHEPIFYPGEGDPAPLVVRRGS